MTASKTEENDMPLFRLEPRPDYASDRAWAWSWETRPIQVVAESEGDARAIAAQKLFQGTSKPKDGRTDIQSPWRDEGLVAASIEADQARPEWPEGAIITPDRVIKPDEDL